MRTPIIAVASILVLAPLQNAFAQDEQKPTQAHPAITQDQIEQQHPEWFSQPAPYRPCEASVSFGNGRPACLNGS